MRIDREDVLRKINIFRTNYRRECSRINTSLQEGRHYQSTLWYFDLLCFLQTTDTRRDRKRKLEDDGEKSIMVSFFIAFAYLFEFFLYLDRREFASKM